MSRAGTSGLKDRINTAPITISGTEWTGLTSETTVLGTSSYVDLKEMSNINFSLSSQARIMLASLYSTVQRLSQTAVSPLNLIQSSPFTRLQPQEECLWIEVPPLSEREIIVDFERMGPGEPLYFDFDNELIDD